MVAFFNYFNYISRQNATVNAASVITKIKLSRANQRGVFDVNFLLLNPDDVVDLCKKSLKEIYLNV